MSGFDYGRQPDHKWRELLPQEVDQPLREVNRIADQIVRCEIPVLVVASDGRDISISSNVRDRDAILALASLAIEQIEGFKESDFE